MINNLTTQNLILNYLSLEDLGEIINFEKRNSNHLKKWESITLETEIRLKNWLKECEEKRSVRFVIRPKENPNRIIGFCNFTQIFYGGFLACYLGYKIDFEYEGKGLMFEALTKSIDYVFESLGIHRIMANYMPINIRSAKLLNRLGFATEGFANNYLLINNKWEDHVLTALSFERWKDHQLQKPATASFLCRKAQLEDLEAIVSLLADDQIGKDRESAIQPLPLSYFESFLKISSDQNNEIIVCENDGIIMGVMQITYLQHLAFQGKKVAHIENVRIHKEYQNQNFGTQMFAWAFQRIKHQNCHRIQLMTDKRRSDAHKFYNSLGFIATHEGMKLFLD